MIQRCSDFDLGQDRTRIKDPRDAQRQHATVDALLERFFTEDAERRTEIQILADEVGMGKTFVALATGYSVLHSQRQGEVEADLAGCCKKLLIITPNNSALYNKWQREVGEFVKRCVKPERQSEATRWFMPVRVDRLDDLVLEISKRGHGPRVIVTHMGIFGGGRFVDYDLKRRALLATLFRFWGTRFNGKKRQFLLKGAPAGWPSNPKDLGRFTDYEIDRLPFYEEDLLAVIRRLDRHGDQVERLLATCGDIAKPYTRGREEAFEAVEQQLIGLYRAILPHLIKKSFPLVIVDEAHNWKNGPLKGSNGYRGFIETVAHRTRRVLLLTATPFQLRPEEMLEILRISDHLRACPDRQVIEQRRGQLKSLREDVIRPVLKNSAAASRAFTRAWSRLPATATRRQVAEIWDSPPIVAARRDLDTLAEAAHALIPQDIEPVTQRATAGLDPDIRQLVREGLRLYAHNRDLSHELGRLVIRHRRKTDHRRVRVGAEFSPTHADINRPDRHLLHAAPGLDVRGDGELPHYLLMRCVSEMKRGKGRSSLGSALTGCYSTLLRSSEGKKIKDYMTKTPASSRYFDLLLGMVTEGDDERHPKVRAVVETAVQSWRQGEKFLIFCFRTNTADRLREIIDSRIRVELERRRQACLGGPEALRSLRTRLTGRDRDLVVLGLDRVLWSFLWTQRTLDGETTLLAPTQLRLTDADLEEIARLSLLFEVDLTGERVDRVFLHRVTEHVLARRLLRESHPDRLLKQLLLAMSDPEWICGPYGLTANTGDDEEGGEETHFDERGVHRRYSPQTEPRRSEVATLATELLDRRTRASRQGQVSIFDVYTEGPSLWLGSVPAMTFGAADDEETAHIRAVCRVVHRQVFELSGGESEPDWECRAAVFQALRRALLRESVLLRLLPDKADREEAGWGELLVKAFYSPLPDQRESMADRVAVFLEDLVAASGNLLEPGTARNALYEATQLRDQQAVALVKGGRTDYRERVFAGFNTPLLPEVLICTEVGQEGIDLHRHCRHVVQYDLAWNPAVVEQRIGRVDRIGSKTFRERALAPSHSAPFLEVGVPFLAGTYDERMYEELRLRAQTFEVLTGGRMAAESPEGFDDQKGAEGKEADMSYVPLPEQMVNDLRVKLHVWEEAARHRVAVVDRTTDSGSGPMPKLL